jgi:hypothetical protein|eukprot:COSAG02_NODE_5306_length_4452_cov_2.519642_5_plen_80_part_00
MPRKQGYDGFERLPLGQSRLEHDYRHQRAMGQAGSTVVVTETMVITVAILPTESTCTTVSTETDFTNPSNHNRTHQPGQ